MKHVFIIPNSAYWLGPLSEGLAEAAFAVHFICPSINFICPSVL